MEVQEKTHVSVPVPLARNYPAPSAGAHAVATAAPPARTPAEKPARAALAPAPQYLLQPDKLLNWVDVHRRKLLAALLVLYALGFNGQWRMEPDSALYLTIGRNLAEGRGYTYHGEHHHLAYPGLPWLFAANFKLFGAGTLLPAHALLLLCGLLMIVRPRANA